MIKFLFFTAALVVLGIATYWLSQNTGNLNLSIFGYEIETSVTYAALIIAVGFAFFHLLLLVLYRIMRIPAAIMNMFAERKKRGLQEKIYEAFILSVTQNAAKLSKLAQSLEHLPIPEKLKTLVYYFAAQSAGNAITARDRLQELTKYADTKSLGFNGLINLALEQGDFSIAINYAEELWKSQKEYLSAKLLAKTYILAGRWDKLSEFADSFRSGGTLGKDKKNAVLALAKFMQAKELMNAGDFALAHDEAALACKLLDNIAPLAILFATIKMRQNNWKGALAVIEKSWAHEPSQALSQLVFNIQSKMRSEKFIDIARHIASLAPMHYESHLLLARAALEMDQYDLASQEIGEALSEGHKVRVCQLMAEFCMRTHGNNTEALSWLHYAAQSKNDVLNNTYYFSIDDLAIVKLAPDQKNFPTKMILIE